MNGKDSPGLEAVLMRIAVALERIAASPALGTAPPVTAPESLLGPLAAGPRITELLADRGVAVRGLRPLGPSDPANDDAAVAIAAHHHLVEPLLDELKRTLATGEEARLDLSNARPEVITACTKIGRKLRSIGDLVEYRYERQHHGQRRLLRARPRRDAETTAFLTGGWLEVYLRRKVRGLLLSHHGPRFELAQGVLVTLPGGGDGELDLLVALDGRLYWFEAKSGTYAEYLERYSLLAAMLGLPRSRCLMLFADLDRDRAERLMQRHPLTFVPLADLDLRLDLLFAARDS